MRSNWHLRFLGSSLGTYLAGLFGLAPRRRRLAELRGGDRVKYLPHYTLNHVGEDILGECPRCRLPIYQSDPRRNASLPYGTPMQLYHAGCAMAKEGEVLEIALGDYCQRLRGLGYVIELKLVRPVH